MTAFSNSLLTHDVKKRITVEYYPLSTSSRLRTSVTAAVRYIENKLRALLGVKSRLAVKELPEAYRRVIDVYFERAVASRTRVARKSPVAEYEKMYDAPEEELSMASAREIEHSSWDTTARLVGDEAEDEIIPIPEPPRAESSQTEDFCTEAINALLSGNYITDGAIAERINEIFLELIGDVVLESDGERYTLIEDYTEDVRNWHISKKN